MIDVKEKLLDSLIYKAKQLAQKRDEKQLLSITKQIDPIHIISFYDSLERLNKDRTFWADVENDFYMIGIGEIQQIEAEENRYYNLQKKWQTFTKKALIHNDFHELGTGLIALGGMSFDPLNKKTEQWTSFSTSELIVPEYMVVKQKTNYYLTLNTFVSHEDNIEDLSRHIEQNEKQLFHNPLQFKKERHHILNKEEVASDKWIKTVKLARDEVRSDRVQKIVMAREMKITLNKKPNISTIIHNLIQSQPNSYVFAFEKGNDIFIGATPERLVRVNGENVLSTCLAGTAPRGKTLKEDEEIKEQLFNDDKNREEHDYVVQMIRKSINPYCHHLTIPNKPIVLSLKDLHHLYTPVTAIIKDSATIFDFIKQLHPTPALGGEPKEESLAFIRKYEQLDRGWYGAPVGWIDNNNNGEFAVAIRSGLIQENNLSLFAGCGVMKDSDPQLEYEETGVKFLPMLNALEVHDGSY